MKASTIHIQVRFGWCLSMLCLLATTMTSFALLSGDFIYEINSPDTNTVTITGYVGEGGALGIPSVIDSKSVTQVGFYAFFACSSLTSVTIPDSVTSIRDRAFEYCSDLTSVAIPDGVASIGSSAFAHCDALTHVTIPGSVTNMYHRAFNSCPRLKTITVAGGNPAYSSVDGVLFNKTQSTLITCPGGKTGSYTVPDSATSIGWDAFSGCGGLTNIALSGNIVEIGSGAFTLCTNLTSLVIPGSVTNIINSQLGYRLGLLTITVDGSNPNYSSLDGVLFNKSQTTLIKYPEGKSGSYTIPGSVTSISRLAFQGCGGLPNVMIHDSVTDLGYDSPFMNCANLMAITVDGSNPNYSSVDGILFDKSQTALIQCPGGRTGNYTIPGSVTSIGRVAFLGCGSLTNVSISGSVTSIGSAAFNDCTNLTSITIPESVTQIINNGGFQTCLNLMTITVAGGNPEFSSIDGVLFSKDQMTLLQYPGGRTGSYILPIDVTSIGFRAFSNCDALTNVKIPDSVTSIGAFAFSYCDALINVTIPGSITNILYQAFARCENLKGVYLRGNAPGGNNSDLFFGNYQTTVYYLADTTGWEATYAGRLTMLWNPLIQTDDGNFGVQAGAFAFNIEGASNELVKVEACTNLVEGIWEPLITTNLTSGKLYFSDPDYTNHPALFYHLDMP